MNDILTHNWWAIALRGVVAIAFGLVALFLPGLTLLTLVLLFGIYAVVDGAFALAAGIRRREGGSIDWWLILMGVVGIVAGIVAFIRPDLTALALLLLIGGWAVVTGALEVFAAYRLRREIEGEWLLALDGLLSIAFGVFVLIAPGAGALAVVWLIGLFAIASGVMLVVLAFRLRARQQAPHDASGTSTAATS